MTSSSVELCNIGLGKLGAYSVQSIDAPKTATERTVARLYDPLRQAELRAHTWNFAKTRAVLTPTSDFVKPDTFKYGFKLPADCLRPLRSSYSDWVIEGRGLFSNLSTVHLRYIRDVKDVSQFDPLFVMVLASRIALESCEAITQSNQKKTDADAALKDARAEAKRCNAFELDAQDEGDDDSFASSWVAARSYGSRY